MQLGQAFIRTSNQVPYHPNPDQMNTEMKNRKKKIGIFFGGVECVGLCFSYVAHFICISQNTKWAT
jgi:hypothetical protein